MTIKREWTENEKESLLEYITELKKNGISIKNAAEEFSKKNPHITSSQARVYYYKLMNETENSRRKYSQRVWSNEENKILFEVMSNLKGKKKKIEIFNILSDKLNRHPKAISSHYYSIKSKDSSGLNSKNLFNSKENYKFKDLKKVFEKIDKIEEVYKKTLEFEYIIQKDKIIFELNRQLEEAKNKIATLEKRLKVS